MEREEIKVSELIPIVQSKGKHTELFGRRIGFSNPKYPCFLHVHRFEDKAIVFMDNEGCKEFNSSNEEIKALGASFLERVMHPEDLERITDSLTAFARRNDKEEIFTFFQRIRLRVDGTEGYTLIITSAKLDIKRKVFICISNTTDQLPSFTKKISNALNSMHSSQKQVEKYLLLTKREKEIMNYLKFGKSAKEIASSINISFRTVEQHKKNLYRKLDVNSIAEIIAFAQYFD